MIDSHIHLSYRLFNQNFPYLDLDENGYQVKYGTRDLLIEEMRSRGVECCIEPAINTASNKLLIDLAGQYPDFIYPAVGNHPTRCIFSPKSDFKLISEYAKTKGVIAIGETGLDYHYKRKDQHRLKQMRWFIWQIDLAHKMDLPIVFHIRDANKDAIRIIRFNKRKIKGGVVHCFGDGPDVAKIYTEEFGFCLGIGGTLLMRPSISSELEKTVASVPMEYLMLETDSPYVKPAATIEGLSKRQWEKLRNTSFILPAVAGKIAEIKGISVEDVYEITAENTRRVFGLDRK